MAKTIKIKIIGNTYQPVSTTVNGRLFYTPKKGDSITMECTELPAPLQKLRDNGAIIVKVVE